MALAEVLYGDLTLRCCVDSDVLSMRLVLTEENVAPPFAFLVMHGVRHLGTQKLTGAWYA